MGLRKLVPRHCVNDRPTNAADVYPHAAVGLAPLLNLEVLHYSRFHVPPWNKKGGNVKRPYPC